MLCFQNHRATVVYDPDLSRPEHLAEAITGINPNKFKASVVDGPYIRTTVVKVKGMTCNSCVNSIQSKLGDQEGIVGELCFYVLALGSEKKLGFTRAC